ncbi:MULTISPECIES: PE domain-containing protein [unclassified Crossiella]|uniref:PE domain-containing protein n=1 Tax=unclassified Crossiella TaxID=2620835 RepID=UPI001FFEA4B0|nr:MULTISPECIES: PE domain-containing protein [unclassified Crossiella]MCK2237107.1 PE domain-containing protein [Crossiella sp. S99.2]MCK2250775.1 PE domain-containing protein [Crossiella sp. S99.1]
MAPPDSGATMRISPESAARLAARLRLVLDRLEVLRSRGLQATGLAPPAKDPVSALAMARYRDLVDRGPDSFLAEMDQAIIELRRQLSAATAMAADYRTVERDNSHVQGLPSEK